MPSEMIYMNYFLKDPIPLLYVLYPSVCKGRMASLFVFLGLATLSIAYGEYCIYLNSIYLKRVVQQK